MVSIAIGIILFGSFGQQVPQEIVPPRKALIERIGVQFDPKNGYFDYVLAGEKAEKLLQKDLSALSEPLDARTFLERSQAVAEKFAPMVRDVTRGNSKECWEPRTKIHEESIFPEYSSIRVLAKGFAASIYCHLANGRSNQAAFEFCEAMKMADRISGSILIGYLVSTSTKAIILTSLDGNTLSVSRSDATKIIECCDAQLRSSSLKSAIEGEERATLSLIGPQYFQEWIGTPDPACQDLDPQVGAYLDSYKQLSAAQKNSLFNTVKKRFSSYMKSLIANLELPESEWKTPDLKDESLEDYVLGIFCPVFGQVLVSAARNRTQLRLLRLHMLISQFKWDNRMIPGDLSELKKPDAILDPWTMEKFQYEIKAPNAYRLYSKGKGSTGEIDMVYRRIPTAEPPDPGPPINRD